MVDDISGARSELQALRSVAMCEPHCPHVIRVDGFWFQNDEDEGIARTFIQMELCQGTLASYLNEKRETGKSIEPMELLDIMVHISAGLSHCHERGVCHRDLKLSNGNVLFQGIINL